MRPGRWITLTLVFVLALTGCGRGDTGVATGGKVEVIAALYPLVYVAERVGAERVEVSGLAEPGVEPHDLELSPRGAARLEDVDLVLYEKGFQPAIDDAVADSNSLDVASVEPLDEADPHVWLDPVRLGRIARAVADRLSEVEPAGAEMYTARADALIADLATLDAAFVAGLESCRLRTFVTSHDAFGYLARRYDLSQVGISGIDPESDPSPARLREVAATVDKLNVTTVFIEPLVSPKVAEAVARETGAVTAVLDPVESIAAGSDDDYVVVMRRNLAALRTALGCS